MQSDSRDDSPEIFQIQRVIRPREAPDKNTAAEPDADMAEDQPSIFANTLAAQTAKGLSSLLRPVLSAVSQGIIRVDPFRKFKTPDNTPFFVPKPAILKTQTITSVNHPADSPPPPFDPRRVITRKECAPYLGYAFSTSRKWTILVIGALVQISMNFNTSLYGSGAQGMSQEFRLQGNDSTYGAMAFLIAYAFGCELFAPWSEEYGRTIVLQISFGLVNCFAVGVGFAQNFTSVIIFRFLGGLSTAGGSVTLGMVADMFYSEDQAKAVAFISWASVSGSVIGPVVGGFMAEYFGDHWRFTAFVQIFLGLFVQALHSLFVPETRGTVIMDRVARRRRKAAEKSFALEPTKLHPDLDLWGPNEVRNWRERCSVKELLLTFWRPFKMLGTEPIVLTLSLLSGFSDGLIFMCFESFRIVYGQWHMSPSQIGMVFLAVGVGYTIGYAAMFPSIKRNRRIRAAQPNNERAQYESRMDMLLLTAPLLPLGLALFAATTGGPTSDVSTPAVSIVAAGLIGVANYAIYYCTIDYMVAAYGVYSASATGGNGFARDFIAGVLTPAAAPFYTNFGGGDTSLAIQLPSGILSAVAGLLCVACFFVWKYGPVLRRRSKFSRRTLEVEEEEQHGKGGTTANEKNDDDTTRNNSTVTNATTDTNTATLVNTQDAPSGQLPTDAEQELHRSSTPKGPTIVVVDVAEEEKAINTAMVLKKRDPLFKHPNFVQYDPNSQQGQASFSPVVSRSNSPILSRPVSQSNSRPNSRPPSRQRVLQVDDIPRSGRLSPSASRRNSAEFLFAQVPRRSQPSSPLQQQGDISDTPTTPSAAGVPEAGPSSSLSQQQPETTLRDLVVHAEAVQEYLSEVTATTAGEHPEVDKWSDAGSVWAHRLHDALDEAVAERAQEEAGDGEDEQSRRIRPLSVVRED